MDQSVLLPVTSIRVGTRQEGKVSHKKVMQHVFHLEKGDEDLLPIDVHALGDGNYTIAGNGRHRYFAYAHAGYSHIPAIIRNP